MQPFPILRDPTLNARLADDGHVVLPLLDAATVQALREVYFTAHPDLPTRLYASAHVADTDFRGRMSAEIHRLVQGPLANWLDQGELLGGSFIAKPQGTGGVLRPHADWNLVDEQRARSYNLWIALVDMRVDNGAVHILPGSHEWFDHYRGPGIPNPLDGIMDEAWRHMQPVPMRAGEALLYDHRLYHASPANQTPELRLAAVAGIILRGESMRHYRMDGGRILSYASSVKFFLAGDPERSPGDQPLLGPVPYAFPEVNVAQLHALLGIAPTAPPATGLGGRIRRWLRGG